MVAKNSITGDDIKSGANSSDFVERYDDAFKSHLDPALVILTKKFYNGESLTPDELLTLEEFELIFELPDGVKRLSTRGRRYI